MNGKGARSIEPQKSGAGEEDTFRNRAAASSPPAFHSEKLKPEAEQEARSPPSRVSGGLRPPLGRYAAPGGAGGGGRERKQPGGISDKNSLTFIFFL